MGMVHAQKARALPPTPVYGMSPMLASTVLPTDCCTAQDVGFAEGLPVLMLL